MAAVSGFRKVLVAAAVTAATAAQAQVAPWSAELSSMQRGAKPSLGLQPGKAQVSIGCGASLLPCPDPQAAQLAATSRGLRWNVELGAIQLSPAQAGRTSLAPPRQGLNLSLIGSRPLFGSSFSLYGRLGTTYGVSEVAGAPGSFSPDSGYGLSFGAGISYEVTPQLSATFGWDSHDLRLGGGGRDAVRGTSLGLQYRY